jgi:hypothetical protein
MRRSFSTGLLVASILAAGFIAPVLADETGLAGMHAWQKIGSKTCMVDHEHDSAGNGATQQLAMAAAVRGWEAFTDLEYGSDWASFANSVGKRVSCGRNLSDISCQISSRACRGGVLAKTVAKPSKKRQATRN